MLGLKNHFNMTESASEHTRRLQLEVAALRDEAATLRERLAAVESRAINLEALSHTTVGDFAVRTNPRWFEPIATEPSVQVHMRDLVKPQHTAFDVGGESGTAHGNPVRPGRAEGFRGCF